MAEKTVAVTGATGYLATCLVRDLLDRGYNVRGTVRNPDDIARVKHLLELPGAQERLTLYKADLLDEGSFDIVVDGVHGVFHTASPVVYGSPVSDPQMQLIDPAVKGTLNLLRAADKTKSVKRVVLTSSNVTVVYSKRLSLEPGCVVDESWWSEEEFCKEQEEWYCLSKILAEKAAWDFAKERHFDLVATNASLVIGASLSPSLDTCSSILLDLLTGKTDRIPNTVFGFVDITDVSTAHILAYEKTEAEGRHILIERVLHVRELAEMLRNFYPGYPVPTELAYDPSQEIPVFKYNGEKTKNLGLKLRPVVDSLQDAVASLKYRGLLGEAPQV